MRTVFDASNLEAAATALVSKAPTQFPNTTIAKQYIFTQVNTQNPAAKTTINDRMEPFLIYKGMYTLPSEIPDPLNPGTMMLLINIYEYLRDPSVSRTNVELT